MVKEELVRMIDGQKDRIQGFEDSIRFKNRIKEWAQKKSKERKIIRREKLMTLRNIRTESIPPGARM